MLHVGVTLCCLFFFFFKQKTAYEMRISDWSSDVCSSDLIEPAARDDAATRETAVAIAEAQIVANGQPLVGIEAADQPVELAVERLALQAQFLGEGMELAIGVGIVGAIEDIDRAVIEIAGRSDEHTSELQSLMRIPYALF